MLQLNGTFFVAKTRTLINISWYLENVTLMDEQHFILFTLFGFLYIHLHIYTQNSDDILVNVLGGRETRRSPVQATTTKLPLLGPWARPLTLNGSKRVPMKLELALVKGWKCKLEPVHHVIRYFCHAIHI